MTKSFFSGSFCALFLLVSYVSAAEEAATSAKAITLETAPSTTTVNPRRKRSRTSTVTSTNTSTDTRTHTDVTGSSRMGGGGLDDTGTMYDRTAPEEEDHPLENRLPHPEQGQMGGPSNGTARP